MPDFRLEIQFSDAALRVIRQEDHQVGLIQDVAGASGEAVTWATFRPFESNLVEWPDSYGLYASNTPVEDGAFIAKRATVDPARPDVFHPFVNGSFDNPFGDAGPGHYGIENKADTAPSLTFGVTRSVTVNGSRFEANPLFAADVLFQQRIAMAPSECVTVFLQASFGNGMVITRIPGGALRVDLAGDPTATIHYDLAGGKFLAGPLP